MTAPQTAASATAPPPRLGFAFVPTNPPNRLLPVARAVEDSGLDDLWVWEDCFAESGVAAATAALATTERIRVGIGLMPTPLRNVALTAMEIATMSGMFPGRLLPGIGHGVQDWMGQAGVRVDSPMTLLREYADALRRLLAGEEVTVNGRYVTLDAVRLAWPPAEPRLAAGGFGPRTLEFAALHTDATLYAGGLSPEVVRENSALVARSRAAAGLPNGAAAHEIVACQGVDAAEDAATLAESARTLIEGGATTVVFLQPSGDVTDLPALVHFLGTEVRPLIA